MNGIKQQIQDALEQVFAVELKHAVELNNEVKHRQDTEALLMGRGYQLGLMRAQTMMRLALGSMDE